MSTVAARIPAVEGRQRAVYTRTHVLGLSLVAGSLLLLVVAALVTGVPVGEAAFFAIPIAAAGVGAFLAWRYGTWGKVAGLAGLLVAAGMTFWVFFGLFQPASFIEFTVGVAHLVGTLLALGGGIASLVRRNDVRAEPTRTERRLDLAALAIVVLAFAVSAPTWLIQRDNVSTEAAAGLGELAMANFEFEGLGEVASVDGQVSFVVRNRDAFFHTFTVDGVVDEVILPGASTVVTFAAEPGQTILYYCVPHSVVDDGLDPEDDMAGTLVVTSG